MKTILIIALVLISFTSYSQSTYTGGAETMEEGIEYSIDHQFAMSSFMYEGNYKKVYFNAYLNGSPKLFEVVVLVRYKSVRDMRICDRSAELGYINIKHIEDIKIFLPKVPGELYSINGNEYKQILSLTEEWCDVVIIP